MPKIYPLGNFPMYSPVTKLRTSTANAASAPTNVSSPRVTLARPVLFGFSVWLLSLRTTL